MGIGYMVLWGFGTKGVTGWVDDGVEWSGYPLDCYDYFCTCGAKRGHCCMCLILAREKIYMLLSSRPVICQLSTRTLLPTKLSYERSSELACCNLQ